MPKSIENRKAVVNVKNSDEYCFVWSVLSALHPVESHSYRLYNYTNFFDELNIEGIDFPIKIVDIPLFERKNPNISINVFGLEKGAKGNYFVSGPLHITNERKQNHLNLLYLENEDKYHFCWIKCLSRLISSQLTRRNGKKFICDMCLQFFENNQNLERHMNVDCDKCVTVLPEPNDKFIQFKNVQNKFKLPFVMYADFESLLVPVQGCEPCETKSFTSNTHFHVPYSFGLYIKCSYDDNLSKFHSYRGDDCVSKFSILLTNETTRLYRDYLKENIKMKPLTREQEREFRLTKKCSICDGELDVEDRVRDHDHITGEYRGCAHNACNLKVKVNKFIPILFHNLSNYDAHLFIKELAADGSSIDVIPQTKEKYISFSKYITVDVVKEKNVHIKLRFLDSFKFMPKSLDELSKNLTDDQCKEVGKYFSIDNEFRLIRQKGIFPYSYVDSFEKLNEKRLPERNDFFNMLQNKHVTQFEYKRALDVWNTFNCRTIGEYSDIYLKSDVLLLADIFENFRSVCLSYYDLDPCHYFTTPGLSWDSMLKISGVKLELFTEIDMLHFVKNGIRGGYSGVSKHYSRANNIYSPCYDPSKHSQYIMYYDANNLYGHALSQHLPTGQFTWLSVEEIKNLHVDNLEADDDYGYIFEVDLHYPRNLHDIHNDFPFCPQNLKPPDSTQRKLIQNLYDKERYVIHYQNMKQCLKAGLELIKIHRALKFRQSNWMKTYIDLNTRLRQVAKNDFERDFFKLMNNSVFGKTMENVKKRVNVKLVTTWDRDGRRNGANILISKPNFHSLSIFTENFVAIQLKKSKICYNKPIYVGFTVLDLSKIVMYDFHYNFIKQNYGNSAELLYTDTDSLIYEIKTSNIYNDMRDNIEYFDTSNYKPDNQFGLPLVNNSKLGLMKDEAKGKLIWEFVGLRSKVYEVDIEGILTKKAKGTKKYVTETLTKQDYRNALLNSNKALYKRQYVFRSMKHCIYTQIINKIALSANDDKRFQIPNSYNTLAWGHFRTDN